MTGHEQTYLVSIEPQNFLQRSGNLQSAATANTQVTRVDVVMPLSPAASAVGAELAHLLVLPNLLHCPVREGVTVTVAAVLQK
jgi:hypothetical protein